tara:strand:+ start:9829 stop:12006 length:2178 start_codon:yes stop_codon:yes gene_type:complete
MPSWDDTNHPMAAICSQWMQKIKDAQKVKQEKFGRYADEAMKFFDGSHDWMWKGEYAKAPGGFLDKEAQGALPNFRMTVNRVFEAVALFGPVLYHRNPVIQVTPRIGPDIAPEALGINPADPMMSQSYDHFLTQEKFIREIKRTHSSIKEHYLNWLQHEADKKVQARRAITEAIIKGMSLLWTDIHQPKGSAIRYPKSHYVSVDDFVVDPDAEYWEDITWVARRVCHPVWKVDRKYNLEGKLSGNLASKAAQGETYAKGRRPSSGEKKSGKTFDLIEYWEVYTKCGFGDRLKIASRAEGQSKYDWEQFGDFCFLAVSEDVPFPLNFPSWDLDKKSFDEAFMQVQWPIPFWTDGGWPFSRLHFHDKPKEVWPISLIKPAIGELRFVNWCMSFLADKVAASSTTYVAIAKAAGAEIQDQIKSGLGPYTHIEISDIFGKSVQDVVSFLDAPQFNVEIWNMVRQVLDMIDKRTGLTELIYGLAGPTQIRSAAEAEIRNQNVSIRPDDMSSQVEDWLSNCALKEMEAAEWTLGADDVFPVLGASAAYLWTKQIKTQAFDKVVRDYDYRVEAGSARKPNKVNRVRQLNEFAQIAMPNLQQFAAQGIVQPYNALIEDWAKANDLDPGRYMVTDQVIEQAQEPSPEEAQQQQQQMQMQQQQMQAQQQAAQAEQQAAQAEQQVELQLKQLDMQSKQLDMQGKQMDLEVKKQTLELDKQKAQMELDFMRAKKEED